MRVDLRSDTVTQPTPAMRHAMAAAEVGDDGFGEDRVTRQLEARAAERLGKEDGLFVPSGTMANLVAARVLVRPLDGVVCERRTSIYTVGSLSALDVRFLLFTSPRGDVAPQQVKTALVGQGYRRERPRLLVLENSFLDYGGVPLSPARVTAACAVAREAGVASYVDGARIFNAAVALGVEARKLFEPADCGMFCLSKGLGAPVGSVLVGTRDFILEARRHRSALGGQMRQSGIIAAAGLVALEAGIDWLKGDHARARNLEAALREIPGIEMGPATAQTNVLWVRLQPGYGEARALVERLAVHNVLALAFAGRRIRLVTHKDVDDAGIDHAIKAFRACVTRNAQVDNRQGGFPIDSRRT